MRNMSSGIEPVNPDPVNSVQDNVHSQPYESSGAHP